MRDNRPGCPATELVIQKTSDHAPAQIFNFRDIGLDLADAFASNRELLADFLQRVVVFMPMPKRMSTAPSRSERGEHARRGLMEVD